MSKVPDPTSSAPSPWGRTIWAGTPAELEREAKDAGLLD